MTRNNKTNGQAKKYLPPIVGLDIGTTKVCAVVGEPTLGGSIKIVGFGNHPSHGLKRGVVVNIEKTVESIQHAVEKAERMSGHEIKKVTVGIAGGHIKGMSGHGMVTLRDKEVTPKDIERVIESANALLIPAEREIIHAIAQDYTVDRESGISDPMGMHGLKLEANVHIVTGDVTAARNIIKCVEMCGMTSLDMVLEQVASSEAVLTEDEKEIGVAMIDFGGGTCDIAVFINGSIQYTESITLGGDHVDRDIAFGLSVPLPEARRLKEAYGLALADESVMLSDERIKIETAASGRKPKHVLKRDLTKIIELRIEEILMLIRKEFAQKGFDALLPAGTVITGGGSKIRQMAPLAEHVLEMPVRIGIPRGVSGADITNDPAYATGMGLIKYSNRNSGANPSAEILKEKNVFIKMKSWLNEFF